jgi:DNA processing protein
MQINQIFPQNSDYSTYLAQIDNSPKSIYVLGELPKEPMIAIVGTRSYTNYGKRMTYMLASELARAGFVIVSGLAMGIDAIAHQAALDAGGKTVAVLAGGLDRVYPTSNRDLAINILAKGGALISEYKVGMPPLKHQFLERNRIIAGLAIGTIVTESGIKGGAMRTAQDCLNSNRTLMAVPADVGRDSAAGSNNLLRSGAIPVASSTDVLQALDFDTSLIPASVIRAQNPHELLIMRTLEGGTSTTQQLIETTQLTAAEFASVVSLMEITGKIRNLGAGHWAGR